MFKKPAMGLGPFASGTLTSGTPLVVPMAGAPLPSMLTLKSAATTRQIALSTDGGITYFDVALDLTLLDGISVLVEADVTHARFTGVLGDTWSIR